MPTDDEAPLAPVDDYEQEADDATDGLGVCSGNDCRNPRQGPFVVDTSDGMEVTYCWYCFATERLRIDPDELGLL
jgi:hypothetical protein